MPYASIYLPGPGCSAPRHMQQHARMLAQVLMSTFYVALWITLSGTVIIYVRPFFVTAKPRALFSCMRGDTPMRLLPDAALAYFFHTDSLLDVAEQVDPRLLRLPLPHHAHHVAHALLRGAVPSPALGLCSHHPALPLSSNKRTGMHASRSKQHMPAGDVCMILCRCWRSHACAAALCPPLI